MYLTMKLVISLDIVKQHSPETFFHLEFGEMIVDETPTWKWVQDLTIAGWTIIEVEQLTKINLGTKKNVQQVKMNYTLELIVIDQLIELLKEFKDVFS
jgi:hypothetical protein